MRRTGPGSNLPFSEPGACFVKGRHRADRRLGACGAALALFFASGFLAGCSQQGLLAQAPPPSAPATAPVETGAISEKGIPEGPADHTFVVNGSPTDIYALLASGAHKCWLGPTGPLKKTHIFQAEAAPAAAGGNAQIILQERDVSQPDQRGVRAFRIGLTQGAGGTKVGISAAKIDPRFAEAMTRDIEVWARGGDGCQLRIVAPPIPEPPAPAKAKLPLKPRPT